MSDWRTGIEAEIKSLYVKAEASYDAQNFEEAMTFVGQIAGIGKYAAFISDGWTKIPAITVLEGFIDHTESHPQMDCELLANEIQDMIDQINAIKV